MTEVNIRIVKLITILYFSLSEISRLNKNVVGHSCNKHPFLKFYIHLSITVCIEFKCSSASYKFFRCVILLQKTVHT